MKTNSRLAIATFISEFGSALTLAALPVMFVLNGRNDGIGIFNGIDGLGALIGAVWAMGFIDRFRKNRVAVLGDILRAVALTPLIFLDRPGLWGVAAYGLTQAIFGATTSSAIQAWIAENTNNDLELRKANSGLELASQLARAIAPAAAALILVKWQIKTIFFIDAITYLIGAIFVYFLSTNPAESKQSSFSKEFYEGMTECIKNPKILRWINVSALQFIGLAIFNTVYIRILIDQINTNEKALAFFQTAFFLGALIASGFNFISKMSLISLLRYSNVILTIVTILCIFTNQYWIFFILAAILRGASLTAALSTRTLCQKEAKFGFSGRVMAFRSGAIDILGIISYTAAVGLFSVLNNASMLIIASIAFSFAAFISSDSIEKNISKGHF